MLSRSLRAETRSRGKEDGKKRPMESLDRVRKWEKKWITIHDTTMKIYKWVPILQEERKKRLLSSANKENRLSNGVSLHLAGDDSNTAMSTMSDSQEEFSNASFAISEDSNSEPPFKKKLID